jgi:hypothetical protein
MQIWQPLGVSWSSWYKKKNKKKIIKFHVSVVMSNLKSDFDLNKRKFVQREQIFFFFLLSLFLMQYLKWMCTSEAEYAKQDREIGEASALLVTLKCHPKTEILLKVAKIHKPFL